MTSTSQDSMTSFTKYIGYGKYQLNKDNIVMIATLIVSHSPAIILYLSGLNPLYGVVFTAFIAGVKSFLTDYTSTK